jgi:hypothetical protein
VLIVLLWQLARVRCCLSLSGEELVAGVLATCLWHDHEFLSISVSFFLPFTATLLCTFLRERGFKHFSFKKKISVCRIPTSPHQHDLQSFITDYHKSYLDRIPSTLSEKKRDYLARKTTVHLILCCLVRNGYKEIITIRSIPRIPATVLTIPWPTCGSAGPAQTSINELNIVILMLARDGE